MSYSRKYTDYPKPYTGYDYISVTVSGSVSDYNVSENTEFFGKVSVANRLEVTSSGGGVGIKLNSDSNALIPVAAGETREFNDFSIQNLYLTNTGGTSITVTLLSYGWR